MARLLYAKGKSAGGMGGTKFPGKGKSASAKKTASKPAAKKTASKKTAAKKKPASTGPKKRVWQLSAAQIKARLARGRATHNSLVSKRAAKKALPADVYDYARKYHHRTRKANPRLRIYDKVKSQDLRDYKKRKYKTSNVSLYEKGNPAGRRPRKGHKRRKPSTFSAPKRKGKVAKKK